jgi:hypothetical protein
LKLGLILLFLCIGVKRLFLKFLRFDLLVNIQGTFREHSGNIQGTISEHSGNIQGTFREHSGNIQGTFRVKRLFLRFLRFDLLHPPAVLIEASEHSGNIQGIFREQSGNIR